MITYQNGFSFYEIDGLANYQDVAINKNSCFVLTSAINLNTVFSQSEQVELGQISGSIKIQPRNSSIYYIKHQTTNNTLQPTLTSSSIFYISPITNTNEVELLVEGQWVQVDEAYPYVVRLNTRPLDPEEIYRQRFQITYKDGLISFLTYTNTGYRYLALNPDNVLRAVGVIFNNSVVNDYVFKCVPVSESSLSYNFTPTNNWVTYYYDIENQTNNKTVNVNKNITDVKTNLLIDFPYEKAIETGVATVNIANLKTSITPAGGPAPVENAYDKSIVTTN